jgi:hypothetical protein
MQSASGKELGDFMTTFDKQRRGLGQRAGYIGFSENESCDRRSVCAGLSIEELEGSAGRVNQSNSDVKAPVMLIEFGFKGHSTSTDF